MLDGSAPGFHVTSVETNPVNLPANTLEQINGELTNVPCYLNNGELPPWRDVQLPVERGRERDPDRNRR